MSRVRFHKVATPSAPATGTAEIYVDSADGSLKLIDDAGVVHALEIGYTPENVANKDTSGTLASNSDTKYPSQKAVKTYVDASVVGLLDDRGNFSAAGNVFPSSGGSGTAGAILKGDMWYISAAGTLGGVAVSIGSSIRALVDSPGSTAGNWDILNVGLGYVPENVANKSTDGTLASNSDMLYPSQKAVKTYAQPVLGYTPLNAAGGTMSGAFVYAVSVLTDGATPALNAALGNIFTLSAAGDRTIAVPSNPTAGQNIIIRHYASGGARTLSLNTGTNGFRFGSDITALTQTASGKTDYIGCQWNAGSSTWDVLAYVKGF